MSPVGSPKGFNNLHSFADRWLLLIWASLLLVLPYTMALLPRSESQTIASAIFSGFIIARWFVLHQRDASSDASAELTTKGLFPRRPRLILVFMVVVSCLDVLYGVPYWSARIRETAGLAFRAPVQVAARKIIAAIESDKGRTPDLAVLLASDAITFHDLRPQTIGITALPSVLERLREATSSHNTSAIAAEVRAYSIFHLVASSLDRRTIAQGALVPVLLSNRLDDIQYGWIRMLGFSNGEVVEIVASPFSAAGTGPINPARLR